MSEVGLVPDHVIVLREDLAIAHLAARAQGHLDGFVTARDGSRLPGLEARIARAVVLLVLCARSPAALHIRLSNANDIT